MKKEYDFSNGERGKFYNPDAEFNLPMLKESEVIEAVCIFLENKGWSIKSRCSETEKGDDIIAVNHERNLVAIIEAKGATSSKENTARYGKPFSLNQIKNHVANAFFRVARNIGDNHISGMALPKTQKHISCVKEIEAALHKLQLEVFWVSSDGSVKTEGFWS
ncbi:MAG: hypothetical protein ACR2F2_06780 [Pyrinomonadaceae bacterium]